MPPLLPLPLLQELSAADREKFQGEGAGVGAGRQRKRTVTVKSAYQVCDGQSPWCHWTVKGTAAQMPPHGAFKLPIRWCAGVLVCWRADVFSQLRL
jgi:hypothetical protein